VVLLVRKLLIINDSAKFENSKILFTFEMKSAHHYFLDFFFSLYTCNLVYISIDERTLDLDIWYTVKQACWVPLKSTCKDTDEPVTKGKMEDILSWSKIICIERESTCIYQKSFYICEEAIQLAYGTLVVLIRCLFLPEIVHEGDFANPVSA
jgi:hypothetical protein